MYCQKCRLPLRLDSSLENLNPAAYDLLVASSSQQTARNTASSRTAQPQEKQRKALYDRVSQDAAGPVFKRHSGAGNHSSRDSAMSFIYLTQSQLASPSPMSPREPTNQPKPGQKARDAAHDDDEAEPDMGKPYEMERMSKLFEILSARSDIDHPVCVECTDMLLEELQRKLEAATKERDAYISFLKELQSDQPSDEDLRVQEEALKRAKEEEAEATAELLRLEKEKEEADREILALEEEARRLDLEEEDFWRERNEFAAKLADFQDERDSINSKFDHDSQLLEKLQRSNVYNDTFCISHDGTFATINSLRLGRLSSKPVDWSEINAAWGHALLLLVTVADKLDFKFVGYEPQPMGSTSKIIRLDQPSPSSSRLTAHRGTQAPPPAPKRTALELYSSGDTPLGLTFMHRKLNAAMVAFLELVRQLGVFVEKETHVEGKPALRLPYRIEGERIGDVSIKLGMAQDDGWTKACKLTLTCCKFLLAHASNVSTRARE
ncbi:related to Beclin 1 (coiled-coil myosin-like BCL2-interacting protein) [Cephalotrichum gorgonifer]|uniref:Related to Beclin 1 (Coiled-coil myosin-like BCL2-interacting protein) n=1 Tax=Cephalotrichum gorgonifer TaxID=2041049 RepID=A0AAE8N9G3_9PEZI|nr:related to Beclin 1 (coiled-coil myosin-like BCL2-interacting protein) [Cephalotrichum gorgonifer]